MRLALTPLRSSAGRIYRTGVRDSSRPNIARLGPSSGRSSCDGGDRPQSLRYRLGRCNIPLGAGVCQVHVVRTAALGRTSTADLHTACAQVARAGRGRHGRRSRARRYHGSIPCADNIARTTTSSHAHGRCGRERRYHGSIPCLDNISRPTATSHVLVHGSSAGSRTWRGEGTGAEVQPRQHPIRASTEGAGAEVQPRQHPTRVSSEGAGAEVQPRQHPTRISISISPAEGGLFGWVAPTLKPNIPRTEGGLRGWVAPTLETNIPRFAFGCTGCTPLYTYLHNWGGGGRSNGLLLPAQKTDLVTRERPASIPGARDSRRCDVP